METLAFIYENRPQQQHQHRSGVHLGNCTLDTAARSPEEVVGTILAQLAL